jgi:alpha-1,2-mannosyltransferase
MAAYSSRLPGGWGFSAEPARDISLGVILLHGVQWDLTNERSNGAVVNPAAVKNPRFVSFAAAVLAVVALLWLRWSGLRGNWVDLEVYLRGAQAIVTRAPLYAPQAGVLPFTYSPFAAVVFTPLHLLSSTVARWVFTLGSIVSYLVAVGAFGRRLRLPCRHLALVALAAMALEPFVRTMVLGQVNLYLMAVVALDCLVMRSSHRGWLVGLAAGIKVVPGVFVLYFVLQRDWRSALRGAAGFLVSVVCGAIVAPQDSVRYWSGGLFGISHFGPAAVVDGKNQSLVGELARISHDPSPLLVAELVLFASGLALGIAAAHRQFRIGDDVAALTAVAIGGLLASPLSWTHHWVWAVPAIMVLVSRRQWVRAWLLGSVFAAGSALGVTLAPSQETLTLLQQVECATYVAAGTGLLAMWAFGSGVGGGSAPTPAPNHRGRHGSSRELVEPFQEGPATAGRVRSRIRGPAEQH